MIYLRLQCAVPSAFACAPVVHLSQLAPILELLGTLPTICMDSGEHAGLEGGRRTADDAGVDMCVGYGKLG